MIDYAAAAFMLPPDRADIPDVSIGDGDRVLLHTADGDYEGYVRTPRLKAGACKSRTRSSVFMPTIGFLKEAQAGGFGQVSDVEIFTSRTFSAQPSNFSF